MGKCLRGLLILFFAAAAASAQANDANFELDRAQTLGNRELQRRNYAEAVRHFTKCIELSAGAKPACYLGRSESYLALKNAAGAFADADHLIRKSRPTAEAYLLRAAANCQLGKADAVREDVAKAETFSIAKVAAPCVYVKPTYVSNRTAPDLPEEIDESKSPELARAMNEAAAIEQRIANVSDIGTLRAQAQPAIDIYTEITQLYPTYAKAYTRRAAIFALMSERTDVVEERTLMRDRAIADLTSSIEIRRKNPNPLLTPKTRFVAFDFLTRAWMNLNKANSFSAVSGATDVLMAGDAKITGAAYRNLIEQIIADASMVGELDSTGADKSNALAIRGGAYILKKDQAAAARDFQEALKFNPNNARAKSGLARLNQTGAAKPAATPSPSVKSTPAPTYRPQNQSRVYNSMPATPDAYLNRAEAEFAGKNWNGAVTTLTETLRLWPNEIRALARRGVAYNQLRRFDEAIADFNGVLKLRPNEYLVLVERGNALAAKGSFDEAMRDFDRAVELAPKDPVAVSSRGKFHYMRKNFTLALADYDRMTTITPKDAAVWSSRGLIHQDMSNFMSAEADYSKAISLDPKLLQPRLQRGQIRAFQQDWTAALADFDEAVKLAPNGFEGYFGRGFVNLGLEKFATAIVDLTQSIRLQPRNPEAFLYRGRAYAALGRKDDAIADFRHVLKLNPDSSAARIELRSLESGQ